MGEAGRHKESSKDEKKERRNVEEEPSAQVESPGQGHPQKAFSPTPGFSSLTCSAPATPTPLSITAHEKPTSVLGPHAHPDHTAISTGPVITQPIQMTKITYGNPNISLLQMHYGGSYQIRTVLPLQLPCKQNQ